MAEDLEAQVRALKQQLLHPSGSSQAVKSPQQRRQIMQLQAELDAVQYERDMEKSHIRRMEATVRHLEVRLHCILMQCKDAHVSASLPSSILSHIQPFWT